MQCRFASFEMIISPSDGACGYRERVNTYKSGDTLVDTEKNGDRLLLDGCRYFGVTPRTESGIWQFLGAAATKVGMYSGFKRDECDWDSPCLA
jgi:hypothetical protein